MKTLIKLGILALIVGFFAISCQKDPGIGGKKNITGTVTYPGGIASGATVKIAYDADTTVTVFDSEVVSDASGIYTIKELTRGNYFISATFTDTYGLTYRSPGVHVLVDKKKGDLTLDLVLE